MQSSAARHVCTSRSRDTAGNALAAALATTSVLLLCSCATTSIDRTRHVSNGARATTAPDGGSARPSTRLARSAAMNAYLAAIEASFRRGWQAVLEHASDVLPADHPGNRRDLVVTVSITLDRAGQPRRSWISTRSTYHRFDNSALAVVNRARLLPAPPPELAESDVLLRWRFHRDPTRGCQAAWAIVDRKALAPDEVLARSLARRDFARARTLVAQHGVRGDIGARLAGAAVTRRDLWAYVAVFAANWQLEQLLTTDGTPAPLFDDAIAEVRRRGARQTAARALDQLARPRPAWLLGDDATQRERTRRLANAIGCATALGHRPSDAVLARALRSRNATNVLLAADMLRRREPLRATLRARANDPSIAGPIAVRLLRRGEPGLDTVIRDQLGGTGRLPTLRALARYPDARFAESVAAIATDRSAGEAARAAALRVLGAMHRKVLVIYAGLRSKHARVRRAAMRAMRSTHGNKLAASYRLAEIAYPAKDPLAAEALATMAVVNHERFIWDILRVLRRLDHDPVGQTKVVPQLVLFGSKAVPALARLLGSHNAALRDAVARALGRIGSARAHALLASADKAADAKAARTPKAAPRHATIRRANAATDPLATDPLAALLRSAAALAHK